MVSSIHTPSSTKLEDYLKAIHTLQQQANRVSVTTLGSLLGVSAGSVSTMVKRLAEQGFVKHEPYQGITLTARGEQEAITLIRTHRLIETLLVKAFGYRWDEVHAEAEALEHHMSPRLIERVAAFLGHPTVDPHGDPIPQADGTITEQRVIPLTNAPLNTPLVVQRVLCQDSARLCYLNELGILPGAMIYVCDCAPFEGPIRLRVASHTHVIDHHFATHILVSFE